MSRSDPYRKHSQAADMTGRPCVTDVVAELHAEPAAIQRPKGASAAAKPDDAGGVC